MVNYSKLGYSSLSEYSDDFLNTLLDSNHTYEFYVNWEKVYTNLKNHLVEIGILNSLNKVSSYDLENKFKEILIRYPEVVEILPSILAIRNKKVPIFSIKDKSSQIINFSKTNFDLDKILEFSIETGLLDLFNNIGDLYSYLVGAEVGLDTNARKNRSGHIFEDAVGALLQEKINNLPNWEFTKEDSDVNINRSKRFDYVLYENSIPKIVIECNFYNSTGSKPIEVAHAYVELQKDTDDANLTFIWVTDGQGWHKMFSTLMDVGENIDFIVNYNMLDKLIEGLL
ncbi:type II restriction endonuclease [Methanobrevibacter sp.]|uniref:type II restriction endonuclease n=1 Tax=Methanobrevibacter sp. TaxID=66852 RepID=UPI0026DFB932|nr:type II restriction endonuclease [Methanobrevibacter sp.]MDO5859572.1 type II restriction endonuclease [Methanobrevibacter sp.]